MNRSPHAVLGAIASASLALTALAGAGNASAQTGSYPGKADGTSATHATTAQRGGGTDVASEEAAARRIQMQLDGYVVKAVKNYRNLHIGKRGGTVTIARGLAKSEVFAKWVKNSLEEGARAGAKLTIEESKPNGQTIRRIQLFGAWVTKWKPGSSGETVNVSFKRAQVD
ncbi:phage tail protein [Streptomyces sp. NPDC090442]|uniref:phage tail protein n=1 Tax=Streptomyces sp. NPDC090442 TaxID=3365962 RepID=UPI0037FEBCBB